MAEHVVLGVERLTADYADPRRPAPGGAVVDGVDLTIERGELFTLLGPSGCGKTTLLRSIAGLHRPRNGRITIAGRVVVDTADGTYVSPNRRQIGMVFQSHAIWPHLDVFRNAAFPLEAAPRRRRPAPAAIRSRVHDVLEMVGLAELADRPAARLSGGQQQRLALARALVPEPDLLLLDEPLSNLDAPLRISMRLELKRLQRELGVTVLFVTHDQDEALGLASEVGVMFDGHLVQVGAPETVYHRPVDRAVATFVGRANLIPGRHTASVFESEALGPIQVTAAELLSDGAAGAAMIRPERVELQPSDGAASDNRWPGRISSISFRGDTIDAMVEVGSLTIEAQVRADPERALEPGAEVSVFFPPAAVRVIPR